MNFADPVPAWAASQPNAAAVVSAEGTLTYRDLDRRSDALARGLERLGLLPGEAVAIMVPTGVDSLLATIGVMKAGLVHVGLNVLFKAGEVGHILRDSAARALIVDASFLPLVEESRGSLPSLEHLIVVGGDAGPAAAFEELLETPFDGPQTRDLDPAAPAARVYTGGTTGMPKGALHDHENMSVQTRISSAYFRLTPEDRVMGALPSFLIPPFYSGHWTALSNGATLFIEPRFDAARVLDRILAERITFMVGTKTMLYLFNELPPRDDEELSFMRLMACGGMPQPPSVRMAFERRFRRPTLHIYGISECVNVIAGTPLDLPESVRLASFDAVGRPLEGIAIRVLREDGSEADTGEPGEVCVGPARPGSWKPMLGYPNREQETARALADGLLHTNDVGHIDEQGLLHVRGRAQELIKVSGWSVFPGEIEAVLVGEEEVGEAAVVGVPDERSGQVPVAFVVPRPGSQVDRETLRNRVSAELAKFKRLREVVVLEKLPANLYGKVQKHRLVELYGEREGDTPSGDGPDSALDSAARSER